MKKTTKTKIILYAILLLVVIAGYIVFAFNDMLSKNSNAKNSFESKDYTGLYDSVFISSPDITYLESIGKKDAPMTFIVVVDFNSEESKNFFNTKIQELYNSHVKNGQSRIYIKYLITKDELDTKTGRFENIQASKCYTELSNKNSLDDFNIIEYHKYLLNNQNSKQLFSEIDAKTYYSNIASKFDINALEFSECFTSKSYKSTYIDMLETEQFKIFESVYYGIDGKRNTIEYMNQDLSEIYQTIRLKEIKVGLN